MGKSAYRAFLTPEKDDFAKFFCRHQNIFCSIFSQKFLTNLETNFTEFELSTTLRSRYDNLDFLLDRFFPLKKFLQGCQLLAKFQVTAFL